MSHLLAYAFGVNKIYKQHPLYFLKYRGEYRHYTESEYI